MKDFGAWPSARFTTITITPLPCLFPTMTAARSRPSSQPHKKRPADQPVKRHISHSFPKIQPPVALAVGKQTDDAIQATHCKRKYKRRGSKTPAMLLIECCASRSTWYQQEQMPASLQEDVAAATYHKEDNIDGNGLNHSKRPTITMPQFSSCLNALSLNDTCTTTE